MELTNTVIYFAIAAVCFIIFIFAFKKPLENMLFRADKVQIKFLGIFIEAPKQEFTRMFENMYTKLLKPEHIDFYRDIGKPADPPTVIEKFASFERTEAYEKSDQGKQALGTLRALRGLGFIEPQKGGPWQADSHIVITDFGREMLKHMKQ